jgi:hypothetical protein
MVRGLTQPVTELRTRDPPGGKGHLAGKADITAIVIRLFRKYENLDVSLLNGPEQPVNFFKVGGWGGTLIKTL